MPIEVMNVYLAVILLALAYFDIKYQLILNVITLPMILIGCMITGFWGWSALMFMVMTYLYSQNIFAGGDVKLMTMLAAFIGPLSFVVFIVSMFLLCAYRTFKGGAVPYAPFVFSSFIFVILGQAGLRMVL